MQVWNNGDTTENMVAISKFLNGRVEASKSDFKAFVINLVNNDADKATAQKVADMSKAPSIGSTVLATTDRGVRSYKINTADEVKNTVIVYKNKRVTAKFVNFKPNAKGLNELAEAISKVE